MRDVQRGEPLNIRPLAAQAHSRYYGLTVGPNPADSKGLRASKMYAVLGDAGAVLVCDATTHHTIRTYRMSAPGTAAVFSADRDVLYSSDEDSNLYEWDLSSGRCRQKVRDAWAVKIDSLALRRSSEHAPHSMLAAGTSSGNVDLFDVSGPKISPEPQATVSNLTTSVTGIRFHHSGELFAAFSRQKKDQLKMVHAATATVFANWPTSGAKHSSGTPLGKVSAVDFSRNGGLFAIGNEYGRVLIYQLRHYEAANK